METPKGMEGFAFLWNEEKPKKEEARGITGGNPPPEEREKAYKELADDLFNTLYYGNWRKKS